VEGTNYASGGGTYPNLLDAHPPFQIDGNFGGSSGITEMLLQSHDGAVHIFPRFLTNGKWKGDRLKSPRWFTVDIAWKDGKVTELKIKSSLGGNCRLRVSSRCDQLPSRKAKTKMTFMNPCNLLPTGESVSTKGKTSYEYDLVTVAGKEYIIKGGSTTVRQPSPLPNYGMRGRIKKWKTWVPPGRNNSGVPTISILN